MKVPKARRLPSGSYNIILRLGNETYSVTEPTEKAAKNHARRIKANYLDGVKIEKNKKATDKTLEQIMTAYVDSRRKVLSPSTINGYLSVIDNRFSNYRNKKIANIKSWQTVIDSEVDDGVKPKTIKNSWCLLAASLAYAGLEVPKVKLPTVMNEERPWLDSDQITVFLGAVRGHPCEIPALLALHGLRRSEILGLTWENVDVDAGTIRIDGSAVIGEGNKLVDKKTNKNKSSKRTIPIMIPRLSDLLGSVPEEKRVGKVYTKTPTLIWEQVNDICEKNGLPKVGVHGLRHSMCSLAFHVGMTEIECMALGGWSDPGTMRKIYTHLSEADKLKSQNKMADFFKNCDTAKNAT